MTTIYLKCTGANLSARVDGEITAGMRGIGVEISFDEAWQGLTPVLVVSCGETVRRMAVDASGHSSVPWECCISGEKLNVGLCGLNEDGTVKLPTVWASCGRVHPSPEDVQAEQGSAPPTPDLVEQITALAYRAQAAAKAVQEAAQRGEFNGQPGVTPELSVGTVTTLLPGSAATASITGTSGKPILNLGIPAGEAGQNAQPSRGTAVVFGDSQFESDNIYSFAGFLREKGIYREVVNYAVGGCAFKRTEPQLSFVEILKRADVLADVERADEIWLHLGGNDALIRAETGGSLSAFSEAVSLCLSIIKSHNPDILIWFVNALPTAPEIAEIYALSKDTVTESFAVSICESAFTQDVAIAYADLNIISVRKRTDDIVFATQGNDGMHPTKEAAAAWFESILASDFKGTRMLDYFYSNGTDLAEVHNTLVKTGKLLPNCTACFHQQGSGFFTVPLHAVFGNATGQIIDYEIGYSIQVTVTAESIEIQYVPINPAEKEWTLKGTITTPTEIITVDMSGCTEMAIKGSSVGTGSSYVRDQNDYRFAQISQSGSMNFMAHFADGVFGYECISGRYAASDTNKASGNLSTFSALNGRRISEIDTLYFTNTQNVTSCNIEIWAR